MKHTTRNTIIAIVATVLLLGGIYIFLVSKRKKIEKENREAEAVLSLLTAPPVNADFPLVYAPRKQSELVKALQGKLNTRIVGLLPPMQPRDADGKNIKELKVDGYFGKQTLAVVKFVFPGQKTVNKKMFESL